MATDNDDDSPPTGIETLLKPDALKPWRYAARLGVEIEKKERLVTRLVEEIEKNAKGLVSGNAVSAATRTKNANENREARQGWAVSYICAAPPGITENDVIEYVFGKAQSKDGHTKKNGTPYGKITIMRDVGNILEKIRNGEIACTPQNTQFRLFPARKI